MEPQRGGIAGPPAVLAEVVVGGVLGKGGLRYSSCVYLMRSDSGVHNALLSWGVPNLLTHTLRCTTTHVGGGGENDLLRTRGPSLSAVTSAASTQNRTRTQQENRRLCGFSRKIDICRGEENIFGTSENTAYGKRNGHGGRSQSHGPGSGFTRTPAWPVPGGSGPPPARTPPSPRPR